MARPDPHLSRKDYQDALAPMALELDRLARWARHTGARIAVLFEGRDTAGKGGVISTISSVMNPRQCRVAALPAPTERERGQWYFQRYVGHLPAAGEIVLFDRSWYNRAGVERVMGYANDEQVQRFLQQCPRFEQLLTDDGILLRKYWLTVDQAQQEARLAARATDPLKRWKLSPVDLQARLKYRAYGDARDTMLAATHTTFAPWTLVDFNDQRRGRLTLIRHLLDSLPEQEVPEQPLVLPPLPEPPLAERFDGPWQPLPPFDMSAPDQGSR